MKLRLHRPLRSTVLAFAVGANLFVALLTILAAYGGMVDPKIHGSIMAMIAMTLPFLLLTGLILIAADLFFDRRLALLVIAGWLAALPPILDFCPLNIRFRGLTAAEKERSFTLLTYNLLHYRDFRGENPDLEANATLSYILSTDADILNLQEANTEAESAGSVTFSDSEATVHREYWKIRQSQLDSIYQRYPYRAIDRERELSVYSKYPVTLVDINVPAGAHIGMDCFRLNIKGTIVHLFNVHLRSIGLTNADKTLYKETLRDVPDSKHELIQEISNVKSQLLFKLHCAFIDRSTQARAVRSVIDSIGGPFIVAGDFNDIPNCYAVRTILGDDMHDAYADAAFGPTITYHGDKFYFRIDQVLYRGPFQAVDIVRDPIASSDHSPLLTTFVFDKQTQPSAPGSQ